MAKRYLVLLSALLVVGLVQAQILNPVKWSTSYKQVSDTEFDLVFTAAMEPGWTIYSQHTSPDGPVPTAFYFDKGDHYQLNGAVKEKGYKKEGPDPLFDGVNVIKFTKSPITFTQRIKVKDFSKPVTGYLEFMTCDDERCLPPVEEAFSFALEAKKTNANLVETTPDKTAQTQETLPEPTPLFNDLTGTKTIPSGIKTPVQWQIALKAAEPGVYDLVFTAQMEKGWAIYSQLTSADGPEPTVFIFEPGSHYALIEKVKEEGKKKQGPDPLFGGVEVIKFIESPVVFTQRIKVTDPNQPIQGQLVFMTCDDKQCLPSAEVPFRVVPAQNLALIGDEAGSDLSGQSVANVDEQYGIAKPDLSAPAGQCSDVPADKTEKKGYWNIFILGFIGGLIALLTPCVFPMIPLTVSFFTKSSGNRRKGLINASMYGFFIFLVYFLLSIPFHLIDTINPDILNDISTNVWLNLSFFAIFIVFAFSFFGYYEITLPESWQNKASAAEGVGGMVGVFFMALTLALVSFSCTGPILGSLLAGALSSDGGAWQLTTGMSGFGLALALPFALFAAFPGWMQSLPRSGGWLNTVKVVLGFVEIALAFKFLSNADLVKHWGLLKIEPFLALWILTAAGLAAYLFGLIRFPHDDKGVKIGMPRKLLGLASFAFAVYLATGFMYDEKADSFRPLKLLSGLAPPVCYSWLKPCDCPQNLNCFKDLEEGLAYAKEVNKPIMIDFTGHACQNCRKMEEHVWPEPGVYNHLKNDYVLISLYVDEKIELPADEQVVVQKATGGTRKLRNYGHKWAHFQTEFFQTNSQPYYVLLSPEGRLLNAPVGYTPDDKAYEAFLRCGLETYTRLSKEKAQPESDKQLGENR
ncbi:MAG: thioredoxin family protein [Saprospiraceae bacterium]|nr:thioredoxin family protein [Saprospiraceae bacterium]